MNILMDALVIVFSIMIIGSIITLQLQYALGFALIAIMIGIFLIPFTHNIKEARPQTYTKRAKAEKNLPALNLKAVEYNKKAGNKFVQGSVRLLLTVIEQSPKSLQKAIQASRYFQVPIDVLLAHWRMESAFNLGGEPGGYRALRMVRRRQNPKIEPRRWKRFIQNEKDLLAICRHCGYDCRKLKGSSTGAVGPMQFQPSTWIQVRVDGDGDGKACPTNIDDALFGAALYLVNRYKAYKSWDGAMLGYAGGNVPDNRAYVRRSRLIRSRYCRIIRQATNKHLPCSIKSAAYLASN